MERFLQPSGRLIDCRSALYSNATNAQETLAHVETARMMPSIKSSYHILHQSSLRDGNVKKPALHTSRLVNLYRRYLDTSDTTSFVAEVNSYYASDTLHRLLTLGNTENRRAASLALSMIGDIHSVESLGRRLCDSDRGVRLIADDAFRAILVRSAAPAHHQHLLRIMHLNDGAEFAAALTPSLLLAQRAPAYAEAHHQLAIAWHGLEDFEAARRSYVACLWRCRFHYPSWIGMADVSQSLNDNVRALKYLDRALSICPDLEGARAAARSIRRTIDRDNPPSI